MSPLNIQQKQNQPSLKKSPQAQVGNIIEARGNVAPSLTVAAICQK